MQTCHDCGVPEGAIHKYGCDMEHCPLCGGQLITCRCAYEFLGVDCSPGTRAYRYGLTEKQERKWLDVLYRKGRIPYIVYPNMCARCGQLWPDMFHVPDEEWERYVEPKQRDKMLCWSCYCEIRRLIDEARERRR